MPKEAEKTKKMVVSALYHTEGGVGAGHCGSTLSEAGKLTQSNCNTDTDTQNRTTAHSTQLSIEW
jgi:hypothetical protein